MKQRASPSWKHHPLHKATAETLEASDLLAMSADRLVTDSARRGAGMREQAATTRTHAALQQTRSMLEDTAQALQRARSTFAPLGLTRAPF